MTVSLNDKQAFIDVLSQYQPSAQARGILAAMPLVILNGVFGGGKNAIIRELVKTGRYHFVISDTTRPPKRRDGVMEEEGVHYHFRNELDMLQDLRRGMMLEAELIHDQQVSGISIRELERAQNSGKIPINEVSRVGVENIIAAKPDTTVFFIVPPSFEEWRQRIERRETMDQTEFANRCRSACLEIEAALANQQYHFIINDDLQTTATELDKIVTDQSEPQQNTVAHEIAQGVLNDMRSVLQSA